MSHKNTDGSYTVYGAFVFYVKNNKEKKKKRKTEKMDDQGSYDPDCRVSPGLDDIRRPDRTVDGKITV